MLLSRFDLDSISKGQVEMRLFKSLRKRFLTPKPALLTLSHHLSYETDDLEQLRKRVEKRQDGCHADFSGMKNARRPARPAPTSEMDCIKPASALKPKAATTTARPAQLEGSVKRTAK